MSFADSISSTAFSLVARSDNTAPSDSILYFQPGPDGECHATAMVSDESVESTSLLRIVSGLKDALDDLSTLLRSAGVERVHQSVERKKKSLLECHDEVQEYRTNQAKSTRRPTGSLRRIWMHEFESLQEEMEGVWKSASDRLPEIIAQKLNEGFASIEVLTMEGLTKLKARHRCEAVLSHLILDVNKPTLAQATRNCRMSFRAWLEERGLQGESYGVFNKQAHKFSLVADSVQGCRTSLSHALSHGGGVPRSLLVQMSGEAHKTIYRMSQTAEGSLSSSDASVSTMPLLATGTT